RRQAKVIPIVSSGPTVPRLLSTTAQAVITRGPGHAADVAAHQHVQIVVLVTNDAGRSLTAGGGQATVFREDNAVGFLEAIAFAHNDVRQTGQANQIAGAVEFEPTRGAFFRGRLFRQPMRGVVAVSRGSPAIVRRGYQVSRRGIFVPADPWSRVARVPCNRLAQAMAIGAVPAKLARTIGEQFGDEPVLAEQKTMPGAGGLLNEKLAVAAILIADFEQVEIRGCSQAHRLELVNDSLAVALVGQETPLIVIRERRRATRRPGHDDASVRIVLEKAFFARAQCPALIQIARAYF